MRAGLQMHCPLRMGCGCGMEDIRYMECLEMPESESQEPHLTRHCMGGQWRHMQIRDLALAHGSLCNLTGTSASWKEADQIAQERMQVRWENMKPLKL